VVRKYVIPVLAESFDLPSIRITVYSGCYIAGFFSCAVVYTIIYSFFGFVSQPNPFGALTLDRILRFGDMRAAIRFLPEGFLIPIFKSLPPPELPPSFLWGLFLECTRPLNVSV
jgi:hypothetical protein